MNHYFHTIMSYSKRVINVFEKCDSPPDAIILINGSDTYIDRNFFYFSDLNKGLFEGCASILYPDGSVHLLTSSLEEDLARKSNDTIHVFQTRKEYFEIIKNLLSSKKSIGINSQGLVHSDFVFLLNTLPNQDLLDVSNAIKKSRMIKDDQEISKIKKACSISDRVTEKIPQFISIGMTENELAAEIDYHLQRYGAQQPAFETISSFGSNTALPHYSHGDKKLEAGDFILCDFGATYDQYHSDTTRVFMLGTPSIKQKKIYETVLNAQHKAIEQIKPNISANTIHQFTLDYINSTEFQNRFIHSTGHSLGLAVHDPGLGFNSNCTVMLEEQMILTVEPGIYIPEFGGVRIEDDILITQNGCQELTTSPKDLIEI